MWVTFLQLTQYIVFFLRFEYDLFYNSVVIIFSIELDSYMIKVTSFRPFFELFRKKDYVDILIQC